MYEQYWPPEGADKFGPSVEGYTGLKLRRKGGHVKWWLDKKLNGDKTPTRTVLDTPEGPWPGPVELAQKRYWEEVGEERPINPERDTCEGAYEKFLASLKEETRKKYKSAWDNDIAKVLKSKRVIAVTHDDVLNVFAKAKTRKPLRGDGETLGPSALHGIRMAMTSFFTWTTKKPHQYRLTNPVKLIDEDLLPPPPPPREFDEEGDKMIITEQEIDKLAAIVGVPKAANRRDSQMLAAQLELFVQAGPELAPRIAEFFAIKLNDYKRPLRPAHGAACDCKKCSAPATIRFNQQISRTRKKDDPSSWTKGLKTSTVNESKKREVACSPHAERAFDTYIARGRREGWLQDGGWLCPQANGLPRNPGYVSTRLKEAVEQAGFDKKVTAHIFRHTWASNALDAGHDTTFIAEVLGNTRETTEAVYAHRVERGAHDAKVASVGRR
jgi:hypothetical protein